MSFFSRFSFSDGGDWLLITAAAAVVAVHATHRLTAGRRGNLPRRTVREVPKFAPGSDLPVVSPVRPLSLEAAQRRLQDDAYTFTFKNHDGSEGRVDVARLPSNPICEDFWSLRKGAGVAGKPALFAGVFDGHSGFATARVLSRSLIPFVSYYLRNVNEYNEYEVGAAIKAAFDDLDHRIMRGAATAVMEASDGDEAEIVSATAPALSGSCAIMILYDLETSLLRTACTRDSRAVRGKWVLESSDYVADVLSIDQNASTNAEEIFRLRNEHPGEGRNMIRNGRLLGFAVTRAFGNHRLKWSNELLDRCDRLFFRCGDRLPSVSPPYMTAVPEVTTRRVETSDFVIIASDRLWATMTAEMAVGYVSRWLVARKEVPDAFKANYLSNIAVALTRIALGGASDERFRALMTLQPTISRSSRDDITIQVIFFKDPDTVEEEEQM